MQFSASVVLAISLPDSMLGIPAVVFDIMLTHTHTQSDKHVHTLAGDKVRVRANVCVR